MKILVPFGTRPEVVKLAPVVRSLVDRGFEVRTVATGQHYDASLTSVFYEELGLRPDVAWTLAGTEADRVGTILTHAFSEIAEQQPDLLLCLGDTYTVPLFCMAARRHRVPVAHLEAGLRSFNPTSIEEVNRKVAAATASLHFAPTELAARFLDDEGIAPERVRVVGNPVIDVLRQAEVKARPFGQRAGVVFTAHRATNVDDPERRRALVRLILDLAVEIGPVTFPIHPRTRARLEEDGAIAELERPGVTLLPPVPYAEMLELLTRTRVIVTDSGGLQEEASWLGVPVVVLRRSTPRWEGVAAGTAVLTGVDADLALAAAKRFADPVEQARVAAVSCPYGDGHTGQRVADLLAGGTLDELLRLDEPDFVGGHLPR